MMKKNLLFAVASIVVCAHAYTQWNDNGNVFLLDKKVGIGTNSPEAILQITDDDYAALLINRTQNFYDAHRARLGIGGSENQGSMGLLIQTSSTSGTSWNDGIYISSFGKVGIGGVTNPSKALEVNGTVKAEGIEVTANVSLEGTLKAGDIEIYNDLPQSDYVFEKDYNLIQLPELEAYIMENKHLPEVPSAKEFSANGYKLGEMDDLLLRKIEELTLYILQLEKRLQEVEK